MRNRFVLSPFYLAEALPELEALARPDWFVNKPTLPDGPPQARMSAVHRIIADFVSKTVLEGRRPVSIAGDCCSAIGVLAGLQRAGLNPGLIWLDAHGDFNTWQTSPSGFLGGMPLAMMVGKGEQTLIEAVGLRPLPEEQVVLADARDLDSAERRLVEASKLMHISRITDLEGQLPFKSPVYVHFDTDVVCPEESPAHSFTAGGGPSSAEMHAIFHRLAGYGQVVAVSLSSWNPALDKDKTSETVSLALLQTLVGRF